MKHSASNIQVSGFMDLFQTGSSAGPDTERMREIPLAELFPFKGHPFQVRDDDAMQKLVESITEHGVLSPAIARPRPEGGYELLAGHRRKRGSELAGKATIGSKSCKSNTDIQRHTQCIARKPDYGTAMPCVCLFV